MMNIANDQDRREAKLRERKAQIEEERRKRIFNVKNRVIGLDVAALDKQVIENELKKRESIRIDAAYNAQRQREGLMAYQLSQHEQQERTRINGEIVKYRQDYQKKENSREFDLNDPNAWKNDIPPCNRDDVGISSAQKFGNEDTIKERKKLMKEQRYAWFQQQVTERMKWKAEQAAAEKAFKQLAIDRANRGTELEKLEKMCKRKVETANSRFNLALAEDRRITQAVEEENDLQDKKAEIYNHLTSGLLCEVHDLCYSALSPTKIVGGAYKGMSSEERERIRKDQIQQIALNQIKRDGEKLEEQKWTDLSGSILRSVYLKDVEHQQKSKERAFDIFKDNMALANEQSLKKQYLEGLYGNNQPSEDFHKQFNKSTR